MNEEKGFVFVIKEHIAPGIQKYHGKPDTILDAEIKFAGLTYTSYIFIDGRILLVLPNEMGAVLYKDRPTLYKTLGIETDIP